MKTTASTFALLFCSVSAYLSTTTLNSHRSITPVKLAVLSDLSEPEQRVYSLVEDLHTCRFPFRIVVIGNGAILESTSILGPQMKLNKSPKSEEYLITLANEDQSFEFHMKPSQVAKVIFTQKANLPDAGSGMKILRFMNEKGDPMCSLILGEKSDAGNLWFQSMIAKYGQEIQL